jgi:Protein of unknown function (DUF2934)
MSEEIKKVKAPAKPKKAVAEKVVAEKPEKKAAVKKASVKTESKAAAKTGIAVVKPVTHEEVSALAARFWAERGYQDGHHLEDWHRAEQELRGKAS